MKHEEIIISLSEVLWILVPFVCIYVLFYRVFKKNDMEDPAVILIPLFIAVLLTFLINTARQYSFVFQW